MKNLKGAKTDYEKLAAMTEDEIDCSDIPELSGEFFDQALQMRYNSTMSIISAKTETDRQRFIDLTKEEMEADLAKATQQARDNLHADSPILLETQKVLMPCTRTK